MSDNSRLSEALYVGLCGYIGTPTEVTVRREVVDMAEMIKKPVQIHQGLRQMDSGSSREGFRFESSDKDTMLWYINHKVITDLSQSSIYDPSKHSIILMEDSDTPPGFVRLLLITSTRDILMALSVVQLNNGMYVSNTKWRQITSLLIKNNAFENKRNHGPCLNFFIDNKEHDVAFCFHCSYWSRLTWYWQKRCALHNWPPNLIFDDILRNGCHFVPVGSKLGATENELEWRLSYSQAEQKLVYSMNHTQFMCYGLLKLFLKEVVNRNIKEPFLCSYFVKTTMFWLIQIGHITWCPNNLLGCFWKCFKYLLHCVHRGVFPNFFIPQNNMFASKLFTGKGVRIRECLLEQLNRYYEMGMETSLLQSPTVREMIEPVICNSLVRVEPFLGHNKSAADTDVCMKNEIYEIRFPGKNIWENYSILRFMILLSNKSLTVYEKLTLQKCTADILVKAAFIYPNISTESTNKTVFRSERIICNLLKLAGRVGDLSRLLFLALHYYRKCRYREALHVTSLVKSRLAQPCIMYNKVDRDRYSESVADWSLSKRIKKAWLDSVCLDSDVYYIQELELEQRTGRENSEQLAFYISPYVVTDMLSVLCNYRLGNRSQCLQSLTDLQTMLLYDDDEIYVPKFERDLSLQILGICQQVVGDLHGALQSYQQSLRQEPWHKIQNATQYRIAIILNRFNEKY